MTGATSRRVTVFLGALALALIGAAPALAQVPLAPGDELLGDPIKKAKKLAKDVVEKTDQVVDDTTGTVEHVVNETTDKANETVDHVRGEIDEVVDGVLETPKRGVPRTPTTPGVEREVRERREEPSERPAFVLSSERLAAEGSEPSTNDDVPLRNALPISDAERPEIAAPDTTVPFTPGEAARSLALPLLMTAAVVAFLLMQGRMDRRDPKMRFHIDVEGERLTFE